MRLASILRYLRLDGSFQPASAEPLGSSTLSTWLHHALAPRRSAGRRLTRSKCRVPRRMVHGRNIWRLLHQTVLELPGPSSAVSRVDGALRAKLFNGALHLSRGFWFCAGRQPALAAPAWLCETPSSRTWNPKPTTKGSRLWWETFKDTALLPSIHGRIHLYRNQHTAK